MVNYNWLIFTPDKIKAKSQAIVYKIKSSGEFWPFLLHEEKQEQKSMKLLSDTFIEDFGASVNNLLYAINQFQLLWKYQSRTSENILYLGILGETSLSDYIFAGKTKNCSAKFKINQVSGISDIIADWLSGFTPAQMYRIQLWYKELLKAFWIPTIQMILHCMLTD